MEIHELTEEERDKMLEQGFNMMNIERKHLSKKELEKEIIDYLNLWEGWSTTYLSSRLCK